MYTVYSGLIGSSIKTKVVKNVSTPIALEMLRHVLYDMEDIDNVYEQAKFVEDNCFALSRLK